MRYLRFLKNYNILWLEECQDPDNFLLYKNIPKELLNDYTLNNKIDVCDIYYDNSVKKNIIWDEKLLDTYFKRNSVDRVLNGKGCSNYGKDSILWILKAIQKYKISKKFLKQNQSHLLCLQQML